MTQKTLAALTAFLIINIGAVASAADVPDEVTVRSITYAGSGCPAGSVAQNIAPDFKAMTLLFDNFIVDIIYLSSKYVK